MQSEHVISGLGHAALIGWIMFGGFGSPPAPVEIVEVAMISGEEYEALLKAQDAPAQIDAVEQPAAPEVTPDAPEINAALDTAVEQPAPSVTETPPADVAPAPLENPAQPDANVSENTPESPDPPSEVTVLVPEIAPTPVERPADRVAPEPVAQPEPDVTPDTTEETAVTPAETGETIAEPKEATAAPEATDKIVTEAAQPPAAAPTTSFRPPARRPDAPKVQTAEEPKPATTQSAASETTTDTDAAVQAALAAALSSAQAEVPTGPPLTSGEKDALRVAVQQCWNLGTLSSEAMRTTVVITVAMTSDAKPVNESIRLVSSSGGSDAAARQAFEAGRRAIIRCGVSGFDLPAEKYGQWKDIEITFDPERMR